MNTPGRRALYNNLRAGSRAGQPAATYAGSTNDDTVALSLAIDEAVKRVRPDSWRGHQARETTIKQALFSLLQDAAEVERIFFIVKQQREY